MLTSLTKTRKREDDIWKCGLLVFGECEYSPSAEQRGRGCPQTPRLALNFDPDFTPGDRPLTSKLRFAEERGP